MHPIKSAFVAKKSKKSFTRFLFSENILSMINSDSGKTKGTANGSACTGELIANTHNIMNVKVITNNQYRKVMHWFQLNQKEREEVNAYEGVENSTFFRYKGTTYDLNDFMPCPLEGWQGYSSDSYFSGVLLCLSPCGDAVKVGRYIS